jgi:hypothetical protein
MLINNHLKLMPRKIMSNCDRVAHRHTSVYPRA